MRAHGTAQSLGLALGIGAVVAVGFLAVSGQYVPGGGGGNVVHSSSFVGNGTQATPLDFSALVTLPATTASGIVEHAAAIWLDVGTGAVVTLGAGPTAISDWDPFAGGTKTPLVIVHANAEVTPSKIATSDTVIDGMVADGRVGGGALAGGIRIVCQDATNHGFVNILTKDSSQSTNANKILMNNEANVPGASIDIGYRQCMLFVYDTNLGFWHEVTASDGTMRRWVIRGYWSDTSLGAGPIGGYDGGYTAGTHLCGLTRLRWASAATTTVNGFAPCNPGEMKEVQVFSGGITLKHNSAKPGHCSVTIATACVVDGDCGAETCVAGTAFLLPGSVDKLLVSGCTYWLQYDGPNNAYYIVMTSQTSGLAC